MTGMTMNTNEPKFKSIRLKNFKRYKDITLTTTNSMHFQSLGKEAFKLIRNCLTQPVQKVIEDMGGWKEIAANWETYLTLELKIKAILKGESKIITYFIQTWQNDDGSIYIEYEGLKYKPLKQGPNISFLDFSRNGGTSVTNEQDFDSEGWEPIEEYHNLVGYEHGLVLNKLGQQPDKYLGAAAVYQLITSQ
jgi:hypothetical protein